MWEYHSNLIFLFHLIISSITLFLFFLGILNSKSTFNVAFPIEPNYQHYLTVLKHDSVKKQTNKPSVVYIFK